MTYLSFILDQVSQEKLLKLVPKKFEISPHSLHVTLIYPKEKGDQQKMAEFMMKYGDISEVTVINEQFDDKIQCVGVLFNGQTTRLDDSFYHITISHNDQAKPVDSNKLTTGHHLKSFTLTGKVSYAK